MSDVSNQDNVGGENFAGDHPDEPEVPTQPNPDEETPTEEGE